MSLTTTQLPLAHSPRYVLNNLTITSTTSSPYTFNTPSPNPFILRTISPPPPTPTPTLVNNYSESDDETNNDALLEGIHVNNPVLEMAIPCLPS